MSTKRIGIGVIGFGWMGQAHSRGCRRAPSYFLNRDYEPDLVVVSDTVEARRDDAVRSFGFRSERIEQLLQQGRQELDEARRVEIYDELQREAGREAPICPLAWRSQVYAMQRHVRHFENLPGFLSAYSPVTLTEVEAG